MKALRGGDSWHLEKRDRDEKLVDIMPFLEFGDSPAKRVDIMQ